jgi:hypothetical protein
MMWKEKRRKIIVMSAHIDLSHDIVYYSKTSKFRAPSHCTISTECSQGVMRDACEHYLLEFTDEILP